ncbi:hypothetical protein [Streptomyces sp. NPDC056405]|uniref:hypothetical protein n=1 Tax=Streptomyces sp. NPDC056405 TaxID=3345811 RepID=UPI0035D73ED2
MSGDRAKPSGDEVEALGGQFGVRARAPGPADTGSGERAGSTVGVDRRAAGAPRAAGACDGPIVAVGRRVGAVAGGVARGRLPLGVVGPRNGVGTE